MTASQEWWPAEYGRLRATLVRMSWHAAARTASATVGVVAAVGRSALRLDSWPDNATWTRPGGCSGR